MANSVMNATTILAFLTVHNVNAWNGLDIAQYLSIARIIVIQIVPV